MKQPIIIIVDDDPIVLLSLEKLLELETTYQIRCFQNPKEALEFLKNTEPEVIISDFLMPDLNGI